MKMLLLVPAFNEHRTIGALVKAAKLRIDDVLVVDDGSHDATAFEATCAGAIVRKLEKNSGKGEALKSGFRYALDYDYDRIITMDGDGQHDPSDIAAFLPLLDQYDLILGNRMQGRANGPRLRRFANLAATFLVSAACGQPIHDSQTGFRSYSAALLNRLQLDCSHYDLETEVIMKAARHGFRIGHCRIRTIYGDEISRFKYFKDSARIMRVILSSLLRVLRATSAAETRP